MNIMNRIKLNNFIKRFSSFDSYLHRTPKVTNDILEEMGGHMNDKWMNDYNQHALKNHHNADKDKFLFVRENHLFRTKDYYVDDTIGDKYLINDKLNPVRAGIAATAGTGLAGLSGYALYRYLKRKKLREQNKNR